MGCSSSKAEARKSLQSTIATAKKELGHGEQMLRFTRWSQEDERRIGAQSTAGIEFHYGLSGKKLQRKSNQDRGLAVYPFNGQHDEGLFCVFDGHGHGGEMLADFCNREIQGLLQTELLEVTTGVAGDDAIEWYLRRQIMALDEKIGRHDTLGHVGEDAGCTCTVVYLRKNTCWVASAGDSRAVVGTRTPRGVQSTDLSRDHTPDNPEEYGRIRDMGGQILVAPDGAQRLAIPNRRNSRGVANSRCIGDFRYRPYGHIATPEVRQFELEMGDEDADASESRDAFLIIASDGIWQMIGSQQVRVVVDPPSQHSTVPHVCVHSTL